MNIRQHLLSNPSRKNWDEVTNYVLQNPKSFPQLFLLLTDNEKQVVQYASQCVGLIADNDITIIKPYLTPLIALLSTTKYDAVKRNVMRILQSIAIPEEYEGKVFNIGMQFIKSTQEPIAVKVFTFTVLRKLSEKYPELSNEVIAQLKLLLSEDCAKGILSRGKKELSKLEKLSLLTKRV